MIRAYAGWQEATVPDLFNQMFRQRHTVYVKDRGWSSLPANQDALERDSYDTDDAVYLIAVDDAGTVLGGARLLPTTKPHLFEEKFAHLAGTREVPRGEHITELTRFYVAPHCRAPRLQYWLTGVIACGTFEYCLANEIRQLTSVIDTFMLNHMLAIGWRVRPLGFPQPYGEGDAIAVLIDVTDEGLRTARKVRGVSGRVLATQERPVPPISMEEARRASRMALQAH
jgi:acyl-homoserine lactone synthase